VRRRNRSGPERIGDAESRRLIPPRRLGSQRWKAAVWRSNLRSDGESPTSLRRQKCPSRRGLQRNLPPAIGRRRVEQWCGRRQAVRQGLATRGSARRGGKFPKEWPGADRDKAGGKGARRPCLASKVVSQETQKVEL